MSYIFRILCRNGPFVIKGLRPKSFGNIVENRIVVNINVGRNLFDKMLHFVLWGVGNRWLKF